MNVPPSSTVRKVRYLPIWEIRLRIWHWSNLLVVLLLFESYLLFNWHKELGLSRQTTALFEKSHIYLGYAFILLFLGRIYLLFKGRPSSRFGEIVPALKGRGLFQTIREEIQHHLSPPRDTTGKLLPPADPGHNQLARFLYLPLLTVVIPVQIVSGVLWSSVKWGFWPLPFLKTLTDPLHHSLNETLSNIHAVCMYVLLGFVAGHLFGIVLHEVTFRSDILSSMIHGSKPLTDTEIPEYERVTGNRVSPESEPS
jgi:Ni/Fe-hydrogenase 1 B-type cytochrome subunit